MRKRISFFKPFTYALFRRSTFTPIFHKERVIHSLRRLSHIRFYQLQSSFNIYAAIVIVLRICNAARRKKVSCLMA